MSELMHLVVHAETGHVLAAGLTLENGTPAADPDSLIGEALLIRDPDSGQIEQTVSGDHLQVQTMAAREDVLMTAREFILVDGLPEASNDEPTVNLTGTQIIITLVTAAPLDETVWVQIEGDNLVDPVVHRVNIPETLVSGQETLQLPSGQYRVLMLAARHRATVTTALVV